MHDPQSQLAIGALSSWAIEQLTQAKWFPLIQQESTARVKRAFSWLVAALAAAGLTLTSHYQAGTLTLTITGLTSGHVLHFLWSAVTQVAMQEGWFKLAQAVNGIGYVIEGQKSNAN